MAENSHVLAMVFVVFVLSSWWMSVAAHNVTPFACDIDKNPTLKSFAFCDCSLDMKMRVNDLVKRLSLEEKIGYLVNNFSRVDRLGIPEYKWWSEALHGVAGPTTYFSDLIPGATSFPQVILTAASFNETLFNAIAKVVSTEARAMYNTGLTGLTFWSPNVNIFRDPRWGRGQETAGEDPTLTSKFAVAYVKGLQERDDGDKYRLKVGACCKHYTAYDIDNWKGIDRYHFNAMVTKQDMEDTFQPPFKSCILDGNVASVMCSYNEVNGKPTCGDADLLKGVIRGQWKLNGYISSDCDSLEVMLNSHHSEKTPEEVAADALNAGNGVDLNCGNSLRLHTKDAIKAGLVKESVVDGAVSNNIEMLMRFGFFDGNPAKQMYGNLGPNDVCTSANVELAREAARQGIVLLKNKPGSLPLVPTSIKSVAVIGPNANATRTMIGNYAGVPCQYTSPLQGLSLKVRTLYEPGCPDVKCENVKLVEAKNVAAATEAVILVMGTNLSIEDETIDRTSINLPGQQNLLISEVASATTGPVILVIMSGGGVDIQFAKENPNITSILWVGFPGEAGGAALVDILFGQYNPSGRLPMTWYPQVFAEKVSMTNMNMRPDQATGHPGYTYRFYKGETVYPFGFGLSYSSHVHQLVKAPDFVSIPLDEFQAHVCESSNCKSINVVEHVCRDLVFDIEIKVTNVGEMEGSHTVLLFSSPPTIHNAPQKQLLDFRKVYLRSRGEKVVSFKVDVCNHLSVVDEDGNRKVALGEHVLHVGDLKHSLNVKI